MKNRAWISVLLFCLSSQVVAMSWQDWWKTRDQQGQSLMDNGDFSDAAKVFSRDDWRAAALYRAGEHKQAAQIYGAEDDIDARYNQGNALAQAGDFKKAIQAYDEVLKLNPKHDDAKHNRDLLEKAMQGQQNNPDQQSNQDKQDKQNDQNNQDNQPDQGKQDSGSEQQQGKNQQKPEQNQNDQSQAAEDKEEGKGEEKSTSKPDDKTDSKNPSQDTQGQNEKQQPPEAQESSDKPSEPASGTQGNPQRPLTEEERAKQQWLRLIPDDPGGLLREKFLRDYWRRHSRTFP